MAGKSLDLKQDKIEKMKAALGEDIEFSNERYLHGGIFKRS